MKQLGENLFMNMFTAKHDSGDFTSTDKFFNGFKTIVDNDIAGTNERSTVLISEEKGNLKNHLKALLRKMQRISLKISSGLVTLNFVARN